MNPDTYYGDHAKNYEAARENEPAWRGEHAAVARLLRNGPVIDCPVGTGRFVELYRSRGLDFLGVDVSDDMLRIARERGGEHVRGSIFALPDRKFGTAVCIRLFQWLEPHEVCAAMLRSTRALLIR